MRRAARAFAVLGATLAVSSAASAQTVADPEAERLVKEGQELLEHGQVREACDKFDLSLKREESVNTLALLAFCHERAGKPGKAWNEFRRVEPRVPSGDKAAFVAQHLRSLESKVARARLDVGNRTIGEVKVDNEVIVLDQGRIVTDPGDHTIRVEAGGKVLTRNATFRLGDNPDIVLADEPRTPSSTEPHDDTSTPDDGSGRRTTGWVLSGVGVVALGIGIFEGVKTLSIKSDADTLCGGRAPTCDNPTAAAAARDRRSQAVPASWISTAGFVLGAAGLGVGIYLIATAGSSPASVTAGSVRVTPSIGPGAVGLDGTF